MTLEETKGDKIRLAILGHSVVHIRQHLFGQELAKQGGEVLMLAPKSWGNNRAVAQRKDNWELKVFPFMGDNIYNFYPLGAEDALKEFHPDWVLLYQEPGAVLCRSLVEWKEKIACRIALFTWENISLKGGTEDLPSYDLIICGNDKAEALIRGYNPKTTILPQVGVPTDIFYDRGLKREINVAYIGRRSVEKGIEYLLLAYPLAQILPWTDYLGLPNRYSQCKMVVCPSLDTPYWREQAPPMVAVEAMACQTPVIVSDAGSIPFHLLGCPGARMVPQKSFTELQGAIKELLENNEKREEMGRLGRLWVESHWANDVIAPKLLRKLFGHSE